jgi:hypothetical protein
VSHSISQKLHLFLELTLVTTKDVKERLSIIKKEPSDSLERKVQMETLNNHIIPQLQNYLSIIHSAIWSYNQHPNLWPGLSNSDILKAQIALDDCITMLKNSDCCLSLQFTESKEFL